MSQGPSPVKRLIDTYVDAAGEPYYFIDARSILPPGGLDPRIPTPVAMRDARLKDLGERVRGIHALVAALGEKRSDDEAVARCTVLYDFNGARAEQYLSAGPTKNRRIPPVLALILVSLMLALLTLQLLAPSGETRTTSDIVRGALIGTAEIGALVAAIVAWRRRSNQLAWLAIAAAWLSPLVISILFM